jgi:hypothetical protein
MDFYDVKDWLSSDAKRQEFTMGRPSPVGCWTRASATDGPNERYKYGEWGGGCEEVGARSSRQGGQGRGQLNMRLSAFRCSRAWVVAWVSMGGRWGAGRTLWLWGAGALAWGAGCLVELVVCTLFLSRAHVPALARTLDLEHPRIHAGLPSYAEPRLPADLNKVTRRGPLLGQAIRYD